MPRGQVTGKQSASSGFSGMKAFGDFTESSFIVEMGQMSDWGMNGK